MKNLIKKEKIKKNKGVAVLFAVLVSVFLVSVTATIISIALRQTILSSTGRDSQHALFAANTVLECAMFWDLNPSVYLPAGQVVFPVKGSANSDIPSDSTGITCNGGNIITGEGFLNTDAFTAGDGAWETNINTNTFTIYIELDPTVPGGEPPSGSYCASATIKKTYNSGTGVTTTIIDAKGYNTCNKNNIRAVERGLQLSYTS